MVGKPATLQLTKPKRWMIFIFFHKAIDWHYSGVKGGWFQYLRTCKICCLRSLVHHLPIIQQNKKRTSNLELPEKCVVRKTLLHVVHAMSQQGEPWCHMDTVASSDVVCSYWNILQGFKRKKKTMLAFHSSTLTIKPSWLIITLHPCVFLARYMQSQFPRWGQAASLSTGSVSR